MNTFVFISVCIVFYVTTFDYCILRSMWIKSLTIDTYCLPSLTTPPRPLFKIVTLSCISETANHRHSPCKARDASSLHQILKFHKWDGRLKSVLRLPSFKGLQRRNRKKWVSKPIQPLNMLTFADSPVATWFYRRTILFQISPGLATWNLGKYMQSGWAEFIFHQVNFAVHTRVGEWGSILSVCERAFSSVIWYVKIPQFFCPKILQRCTVWGIDFDLFPKQWFIPPNNNDFSM